MMTVGDTQRQLNLLTPTECFGLAVSLSVYVPGHFPHKTACVSAPARTELDTGITSNNAKDSLWICELRYTSCIQHIVGFNLA